MFLFCPTWLVTKMALDMCARTQFEDHLPEPIALAALDYFNWLESAKCRIRCVEPLPEGLWLEKGTQCIGQAS